jgi:two-component system chemotaxis response regulator CheY
MRFNVLIVDDSAVMRKMILRTLQLSGLPMGEVHEAGNGQEALDVMDGEWIDLALVDINMPVMNGEEFIRRVRKSPEFRDLSIIVVSTESSETRIEAIRGLGALFVHKPFTPDTLRERVLEITGVSHELVAGFDAAAGGDFDF